MKFVLCHRRKKNGNVNVERREATRLIEYKGLYFAACPNRADGGRPHNYDIFEVSTGLRLTQVFRIKDAYSYIRDNFYFVTNLLKTPHMIEMMKDINKYSAENGDAEIIVDMQRVFDSLYDMGIIENLLI